ncbi:hypothetical protein WDU94_005115 [Cyamophila willieti]
MSDTEEFNLYLANLEEFVFDENKIVSIGWLSRTLDISVELSKKLLSTFLNDETFKSKLSTCWFLYGSSKSDSSSHKMVIVPESKLDGVKDKFEKITSQHVYSIQKSGNTDMNSVYLADQSAEKSIAQCSSLSNIKCDHVKIVPNRRNLPAPITAASTSATSNKPPVTNNTKSSESVKKSPVKSTIGNMFNKKKEEIEKKQQSEKSNKQKEKEEKKKKQEEEKPNKEVEKTEKDQKFSVSPAKKSGTGAGKKKGSEKSTGSANITSFFSKGASSLPPIKKSELKDKQDVKSSTKANKETKGNSDANKSSTSHESDNEPMDVEETDENVEPVKKVENVNVEKEKDKDEKKKTNKESKSNKNKKKSSSKASGGKKKAVEKETQRKRIRVFSDSSESEKDEEPERERSISPPPPSPPSAKPAISDDDEDDVIPPTPEANSNGGGGRKRKRKLVTKTMTDASGFLRTVKEFETVSCSESDGESTNPPSAAAVKQDSKKQKLEDSKVNKKSPPTANKTTAKSPTKSKQTSILNFFKKSS